jgi:UMF1 family MFS transporter
MAIIAAPDTPIAAAPESYPPRSAVLGWMLFDWAAQPYFTLITTFVFAPYFATHVAADPASGQSLWGFATAAAGFLIAVASPVLGAIADAGGRRKPWIAAFGAMLVIRFGVGAGLRRRHYQPDPGAGFHGGQSR